MGIGGERREVWTVEARKKEGRGGEGREDKRGHVKGWFKPRVQNPEKYPVPSVTQLGLHSATQLKQLCTYQTWNCSMTGIMYQVVPPCVWPWLTSRATVYRSTEFDQFAGFMSALQRCRRQNQQKQSDVSYYTALTSNLSRDAYYLADHVKYVRGRLIVNDLSVCLACCCTCEMAESGQ